MAHAPRRNVRRSLVVGGVLVLLAWLGAVALVAAQAFGDRRDARLEIDRAEAVSTTEGLAEGKAIPHLRRANQHLSRLDDRLGSPVLLPIRWMPVAGRQLGATERLAGASAETTVAAADALEEATRLLDAQPASITGKVELVRALGVLAQRTDERLSRVDPGSGTALVGPIGEAYDEVVEQLIDIRVGLRRASLAARTVADVLTGPRRYLLLALNNAEMRAGAGMVLSVGELRTTEGRIELSEVRSVDDFPVPPDAVPLTGDMADRWGWLAPNWEWRNLMLSPRFAESAALASKMWVAAGNQPVDGVLGLDVVAVREILDATGPVVVDERRYSAGNVVQELLHDQYGRFPPGEFGERREALGRVARAAFEAFSGGRWSATGLGPGLAGAARGRHLLAWSASPDEQSGWEAAGLGGSVGPTSLLVAVHNRGANKLDYLVASSADLDFTRDGRETQVELRFRLDSRATGAEAPYVLGPYANLGAAKGEYLGLLAVTLPENAREAHVEGFTTLAVSGPDGPTRVIGVPFRLPAGERREFTVRFRVPGRHGELRIEPSARVPNTDWRSGPEKWADHEARTVAW